MAELVCCLSIIPHMRSFDVPPKLSPAHAGLFLRRESCGRFVCSCCRRLDRLRDLLVLFRHLRETAAAEAL
jgi:hypothetical protein